MAEKNLDIEQFELLLAARGVPGVRQLEGYRVKQWPAGMVSAYTAKSVDVDVGKMCVTSRLSTPTPDLSNDIVIGKGIDDSMHQHHRLVLLQHNATMPIARAEDQDGNYTKRLIGEDTFGTSYFFQNSLESEQAFRLIEMGALPGASIKIKPKAGQIEMVRSKNGDGPFALIKECLLFEWSHVFIPDNPEALVVAIEKGLGGKPVVDSLRQLFLPMLPARAPIVQGARLQTCGAQLHPCAANCGCDKCKPPTVAKGAACLYGDKPMSDDHRPHGAQYGAAMYEMALAMSEFAEEQGKSLEPESSEAYSGVHEKIHALASHIKGVYEERYPSMEKLGDPEEEPKEDDKPTEKSLKLETPEQRDERRKALTPEQLAADDEREQRLVARQKSRALVRGWWGERQKAVQEAETGTVRDAAALLEQVATSKAPISNGQRTKAASLAKRLTGTTAPAKAAVQSSQPATPAPVDDWGDVMNAIKERDATVATVATRVAKLGA